MSVKDSIRRWMRGLQLATVAFAAGLLVACASGMNGTQSAEDAALEARVAGAIAGASDLPTDAFDIAANGGAVHISGSVVCESCGGMLTPGGIQTIQQTLGAVVRAVPGVESVEFDLTY